MLAEASLEIHVEKFPDATLLAVRGDVDPLTCTAFKAAIVELLSDKTQAIVLDLTDVSFFGSAGVSILVATHTEVGDRSRLAVVAGPITQRVLQVTKLDDLLAIYPTRETAIAAMRTG